ncbi:glycosyltransferase involved in cell wall biosynthesis [Winogradskyella wandonensis]|uniref:Glycosyltransferase involved in cell wall biosynthesis n=1 Tax=Winogradskyella wandonensis TaxID=1442586 RepID=A0A4R1KQR7_9FLAO|nr:glycosyltransferase family A protein [Winogradskyella wandonensis]TCK66837.1 glycosyltransferase involved in cell wall biosynthesis [Winogradskyella wandonensis]
MPPFFSVVIPLYNKEKYIKKTLETVINQTFEDFEVIVVNDGSTDNSVAEVKKIDDYRITIFNQENQGLSHTRNNAISYAKANYIAMIDADDYWEPNHLQTLYDLIKDYPNQGAYCTGYTLKKTESIYHRANFNGLEKNFRDVVPDFFKHSLEHCIAWVGSTCIPKYVFEKVGNFDPEIYSEQDIDLYIRIALNYKFVLDNSSVTAIYNRTMDDNMSNFNEKKAIPKFLNSYKNEEKQNPNLNRYMDLNRFATLVFFKLSGKTNLEEALLKAIDFKNLTGYQRLILRLPNSVVRWLFKIKDRLKLNPHFIFKAS